MDEMSQLSAFEKEPIKKLEWRQINNKGKSRILPTLFSWPKR